MSLAERLANKINQRPLTRTGDSNNNSNNSGVAYGERERNGSPIGKVTSLMQNVERLDDDGDKNCHIVVLADEEEELQQESHFQSQDDENAEEEQQRREKEKKLIQERFKHKMEELERQKRMDSFQASNVTNGTNNRTVSPRNSDMSGLRVSQAKLVQNDATLKQKQKLPKRSTINNLIKLSTKLPSKRFLFQLKKRAMKFKISATRLLFYFSVERILYSIWTKNGHEVMAKKFSDKQFLKQEIIWGLVDLLNYIPNLERALISRIMISLFCRLDINSDHIQQWIINSVQQNIKQFQKTGTDVNLLISPLKTRVITFSVFNNIGEYKGELNGKDLGLQLQVEADEDSENEDPEMKRPLEDEKLFFFKKSQPKLTVEMNGSNCSESNIEWKENIKLVGEKSSKDSKDTSRKNIKPKLNGGNISKPKTSSSTGKTKQTQILLEQSSLDIQQIPVESNQSKNNHLIYENESLVTMPCRIQIKKMKIPLNAKIHTNYTNEDEFIRAPGQGKKTITSNKDQARHQEPEQFQHEFQDEKDYQLANTARRGKSHVQVKKPVTKKNGKKEAATYHYDSQGIDNDGRELQVLDNNYNNGFMNEFADERIDKRANGDINGSSSQHNKLQNNDNMVTISKQQLKQLIEDSIFSNLDEIAKQIALKWNVTPEQLRDAIKETSHRKALGTKIKQISPESVPHIQNPMNNNHVQRPVPNLKQQTRENLAPGPKTNHKIQAFQISQIEPPSHLLQNKQAKSSLRPPSQQVQPQIQQNGKQPVQPKIQVRTLNPPPLSQVIHHSPQQFSNLPLKQTNNVPTSKSQGQGLNFSNTEKSLIAEIDKETAIMFKNKANLKNIVEEATKVLDRRGISLSRKEQILRAWMTVKNIRRVESKGN